MTQTTATATRPSPIFTELTTILGFLRSVAGDLPDPSGITVYGRAYRTVHLMFDSAADLREWAAYLQVPVTTTNPESTEYIHHTATATWGPTHGEFVEFDMAFLERPPVPMPTETYKCEHCGAQFGIAGGYVGSPEDDAADDYFRAEIERHESGECI